MNQHRGVPGLENEVERLDQSLKSVRPLVQYGIRWLIKKGTYLLYIVSLGLFTGSHRARAANSPSNIHSILHVQGAKLSPQTTRIRVRHVPKLCERSNQVLSAQFEQLEEP